ncbi:MAG TPA: alcohol dehydrogenase, partial [Caldithrix sp.]|nr:alcohol dehydrogenase [Caldithrix sp.]
MKTMKAVVLSEVKGIDGFTLTEVPRPKPGSGEVVVQIRAAALNHRDLWIARGLYARIVTPVILGSDGAGVISDVGEGVSQEWLNREVIINPSLNWGNDPAVQQKDYRILGMPDNGTQAEYVVVPVTNVREKPAYLSWEEAAAIPLGGLTGYRALFTRGGLKAGETVLLI